MASLVRARYNLHGPLSWSKFCRRELNGTVLNNINIRDGSTVMRPRNN